MTVGMTAERQSTGNSRTDRIIKNVQNLLALETGEMPYDRLRGMPSDIVDLPPEEAKARFLSYAPLLIARCEPRARLVSFDSVTVGVDGTIDFKAVIEID